MRHDTGEVLDYVGGQADSGGWDYPGNRRTRSPFFREDKLRLFAGSALRRSLSVFKIEPETFDAIRRHAREINQVSAEAVA